MLSKKGGFDAASIHWLLLYSVLVVLAASGYKYWIAENYEYLVEAPCDSHAQECYERNCEDDYCPPNNLSIYRVFSMPADKFRTCSDNTCLDYCVATETQCVELLCSEQVDVACVGPGV